MSDAKPGPYDWEHHGSRPVRVTVSVADDRGSMEIGRDVPTTGRRMDPEEVARTADDLARQIAAQLSGVATR